MKFRRQIIAYCGDVETMALLRAFAWRIHMFARDAWACMDFLQRECLSSLWGSSCLLVFHISRERVQGIIWHWSRGKIVAWSDSSVQNNPSYSLVVVEVWPRGW